MLQHGVATNDQASKTTARSKPMGKRMVDIATGAANDRELTQRVDYKFRRNHHATKKTPKQTASASATLITA
jgi:hypothetical protein